MPDRSDRRSPFPSHRAGKTESLAGRCALRARRGDWQHRNRCDAVDSRADGEDTSSGRENGRTILLTAHRRENHGRPLESICRAVLRLLERFGDLKVVYPVHMSPHVRRTVFPMLGGHERIELTDPMDYLAFVQAMDRSHLILTDSGGVQEEAPSLGKPVLVLREITERPEATEAGVALVVGTDEDSIVNETTRLLRDEAAYARMARAVNPYGDGWATDGSWTTWDAGREALSRRPDLAIASSTALSTPATKPSSV